MCYAQEEHSGWLSFTAGAKGWWWIMPLNQRMVRGVWHSRCWLVPPEQPRGAVASLVFWEHGAEPFSLQYCKRNNCFLIGFNMLHMVFWTRILNGAGVGVKWTLKKWCALVLSLTFVTGEALLSVAENSHGEFKTSAVPELSGSFFKRSRIRPRVVKINTFNLETSICSHFSRCTSVCQLYVLFIIWWN